LWRTQGIFPDADSAAALDTIEETTKGHGVPAHPFAIGQTLIVSGHAIAAAETLTLWPWQPVAWGALARGRSYSKCLVFDIFSASGLISATVGLRLRIKSTRDTRRSGIRSWNWEPFSMLGYVWCWNTGLHAISRTGFNALGLPMLAGP
jgi:hypothetical protein